MNERIKQLALKAGLSHMPSNYPDMADLYKGADFELEKFAELIVRELADIAKHHVMNISTYADADFVEKQIQEHFGVKE